MSNFLLAIQFLTVFPVKAKDFSERDMAAAMVYFPLVGLLLGLVLCGINALLYLMGFSVLTVNIILVVALIALSAGLHLDGLADSADAFLSARPKEQMLTIMRDPHIGVKGVLSLISIILLKFGLLSSLSATSKIPALLLMCVLSRWAAVVAIFFFPYARNEGKAKVFIEGMNARIFSFSTIAAVLCAVLIWRLKGLAALLAVAGFAYLSGRIFTRKIEGITGDTLGAIIELAEVVTLSLVYILGEVNTWIV